MHVSNSLYIRASAIAIAMSLSGAQALAAQDTSGQPIAAPAQAQSPVSAAADPDSADSGQIVVTGTRVARNGYDAPTPVTTLRQEDLVKNDPSNIANALNQLPEFRGSISPQTNGDRRTTSAAFGNILSLRGLGGERTLVLVDGVRRPATNYQGNVNVDIIPNLLVQRVDVVTGGASAAYGSDAVAGVVNFLLDTHFEGLKGTAQRGISDRGDNGQYRLGVAYGTRIGSHAHIIASVDRIKFDGLLRSARPELYRAAILGSVIGGGTPGTASNPYADVSGDLRGSSFSPGGYFLTGPFAGTGFTAPGTYRTLNPGTPTGTTGIFLGGDYTRQPDYFTIVAPQATTTGFARAEIEFGDTVAYVQGTYSRSDYSNNGFENKFRDLRIFSGNAFLPIALQQQLTARNVAQVTFTRQFEELGPTVIQDRLTNYVIQGGLKGKISRFSWNLDLVHGRSEDRIVSKNDTKVLEFNAAIDAVRDPATGNIVCRALLDSRQSVRDRYAGCVPFNAFGAGAASPAAVAYVLGESRSRGVNETSILSGSVQGDLFTLWAGPVSAAVGGEYRRETLSLTSNADPNKPVVFTGQEGRTNPSFTVGTFRLNNLGLASGKVTVKEGFGEVVVPLLRDSAVARSLDLNAAVRYTDYSTSGTVTTWKAGGSWLPVEGLRLRATRSRDIRAPSLFNLFADPTFSPSSTLDPHTNISAGVTVQGGGNLNLRPEKADTFTAGAVIQPAFLRGFALAVDYFRIKIADALAAPAIAAILRDCELSNGTASACSFITRPLPFSDHTAANFPTLIKSSLQNYAFVKNEGIDFDLSYRAPLFGGRFDARLLATYTLKDISQQGPNDAVIVRTNQDQPRSRGTLTLDYTRNGAGVSVRERYIGSVRRGVATEFYLNPTINPVYYTDLTVSYRIPVAKGGTELFLTVNNLFDRDPPFAPQAPSSQPVNLVSTNANLYDIIGRTFTAGMRFNF